MHTVHLNGSIICVFDAIPKTVRLINCVSWNYCGPHWSGVGIQWVWVDKCLPALTDLACFEFSYYDMIHEKLAACHLGGWLYNFVLGKVPASWQARLTNNKATADKNSVERLFCERKEKEKQREKKVSELRSSLIMSALRIGYTLLTCSAKVSSSSSGWGDFWA